VDETEILDDAGALGAFACEDRGSARRKIRGATCQTGFTCTWSAEHIDNDDLLWVKGGTVAQSNGSILPFDPVVTRLVSVLYGFPASARLPRNCLH
jgi:hypothetical protein